MAESRPQLEVLGTIVVPNAIAMMNRFTTVQVPSKQILRHENVLEDIWTTRGIDGTALDKGHEGLRHDQQPRVSERSLP